MEALANISFEHEKMLHTILDEGIEKIKTESGMNENPSKKSEADNKFLHYDSLKQSSASPSKELAMSKNYERMQQELQSLQDKMDLFEKKLSSNSFSNMLTKEKPARNDSLHTSDLDPPVLKAVPSKYDKLKKQLKEIQKDNSQLQREINLQLKENKTTKTLKMELEKIKEECSFLKDSLSKSESVRKQQAIKIKELQQRPKKYKKKPTKK